MEIAEFKQVRASLSTSGSDLRRMDFRKSIFIEIITKRHLNEYTSLDFEMGYIDSFEEIMAMETGFLQYAMKLLKEDYAKELEILKVELPDASRIPAVRFDVAKSALYSSLKY